jgi:hypothetical protein
MSLLLSADTVASASFSALSELLQPAHGLVQDTAAAVLRQIMPGLLGLEERGLSSSKEQNSHPQRSAVNVRTSIITFARATVK